MMKLDKSALQSEKRNITINGRRTSVLLENYIWQRLEAVCNAEGCSLDDICTRLRLAHPDGKTSLARIIRYFCAIAG